MALAGAINWRRCRPRARAPHDPDCRAHRPLRGPARQYIDVRDARQRRRDGGGDAQRGPPRDDRRDPRRHRRQDARRRLDGDAAVAGPGRLRRREDARCPVERRRARRRHGGDPLRPRHPETADRARAWRGGRDVGRHLRRRRQRRRTPARPCRRQRDAGDGAHPRGPGRMGTLALSQPRQDPAARPRRAGPRLPAGAAAQLRRHRRDRLRRRRDAGRRSSPSASG